MSTLRIIVLGVGFATIGMTLGCDPCRELGEKICHCHESELEVQKCIADLNEARSHTMFEKSGSVSKCEDVLKNCSCSEIMAGNMSACGLTR